MSATKSDPEVHAVNTIVQALRPLDSEAQQRVLQSSLALLGLAIAGPGQATPEIRLPTSPSPSAGRAAFPSAKQKVNRFTPSETKSVLG